MPEDVSVLRSRLLSHAGDPAERAGLVDALPASAPAVGVLVELLGFEQSPVVQARALRRLGRLGDAAVLEPVRGFLKSEQPDVVAAAAEAVLRLDRQRGVELIRPLLDESDAPRRVAIVRALLDVGTLDGSGVIVRMSLSESQDRRRLALQLLASIASEVAWPHAWRMFEQESDPALLEEEARLLERTLPESGIEKLYDLRLGLDLAREEQGDDPTVDQRLELIARVLASLFRTFRLRPAEVEALEREFDRRARGVLRRVDGPSKSGDPRSESATRLARPRTRVPDRRDDGPIRDDAGERRRLRALAAGAVLALCVTTLWTLARARPRLPPNLPRPVDRSVTQTALGRIGDEVSFEAEVLQADPGRSTLVVLKDRSIAAWVFVRGSCPWALLTAGRPVRIEGRLIAARDPRSAYVESDSVRPAPLRP